MRARLYPSTKLWKGSVRSTCGSAASRSAGSVGRSRWLDHPPLLGEHLDEAVAASWRPCGGALADQSLRPSRQISRWRWGLSQRRPTQWRKLGRAPLCLARMFKVILHKPSVAAASLLITPMPHAHPTCRGLWPPWPLFIHRLSTASEWRLDAGSKITKLSSVSSTTIILRFPKCAWCVVDLLEPRSIAAVIEAALTADRRGPMSRLIARN